MKPGPLIMLILGIVLTLFGGALVAGGAVAALGNAAQGTDGFFTSPAEALSTDSYALTSRFDAPAGRVPEGAGPVDPDLASFLVEVASTTGSDVFVGIAPTDDVAGYLAGVAHTEVRDIQTDPFRVNYLDVPGTERPEPPTSQDFWIQSASGPGRQSITTSWEPGAFSLVVMNADAGQQVSVDVRLGARTGLLGPVATALLGVGVLLVLVGLLLLILGVVGLARGGRSNQSPPATGPGAPAPAVPAAPERPRYPAG
ncbi:hypothetical protein [Cryobacterium sp.]|jgi:hypothetical protein|uniref:hypothetical protein n=1 Tax=Cryobacterium sp. TaxID=1926290 RepID=UPI0026049BED|nr:hypothetical protein [Cryobacterium sp.]MCU1446953.1 hypothetical protein [Cryobacterium sp.]